MWVFLNQFYWNSSKEKKYVFYSKRLDQSQPFNIFQHPYLGNKIHVNPHFSFCWMNRICAMKSDFTKFSVNFPKQVINNFSFNILFTPTLRFPKKCWHLTMQSTSNLHCLVKMKIFLRVKYSLEQTSSIIEHNK